jgi:hypothetical protein
MPEAIPGGWSPWRSPITGEALQVFEAVTKHLVGVHYTPIAYATQVVAGLNYAFLTLAKPVIVEPTESVKILYVFKPLQGDPHITHIVPVNP